MGLLSAAWSQIERCALSALFGHRFPPPGLLVDFVREPRSVEPAEPFDPLADDDGFLYAVPKKRRSLQKRRGRRFGVFHYPMGWKILLPKKNIRTCVTCGHHHEVGHLCSSCYSRVKEETTQMQEKIKEELGITEPIDSEVVVLYEGEERSEPEEFYHGKRIIEMKKPRPPWFTKNLLQKTTQQPATSADIKPTELA